MSTTYAVTVQVHCDTPEEAVKRTIIPGSVEEAEVQDLACQIQYPPRIKVPPRLLDQAMVDELQVMLALADSEENDALPL